MGEPEPLVEIQHVEHGRTLRVPMQSLGRYLATGWVVADHAAEPVA